MQFGPDNKVKLDSLNKEEAKEYIFFLALERQRHLEAIQQANRDINHYQSPVLTMLFKSAIYRHEVDIKQAEEKVSEVRERFKI